MIIDLTCYPAGIPEEVTTAENASTVLGIDLPPGWPPLKVITDSGGHVRAADFASAIILLVFAKGGPALPDLPALEEVAAGWLAGLA